MWTLGKTAALAATARRATRQQERTRRLGERHRPRPRDPRARDAAAVRRLARAERAAAADRRAARALPHRDARGARRPALGAASARSRRVAHETGTTLRAEIAAARREQTGAAGRARLAERASRCPPRLEALAQSVLAEALRNARQARRADARRRASCADDDDTFSLEVRNDGVAARRDARRGSGHGPAAGGVRGAPARRLRRVRRRQGRDPAGLARAARRAGRGATEAGAP